MALPNLSFATAIGAGSVVSSNNTVVLGRAADTVQIPGSLNVAGAINGTGSGLTGLNASNITTGTLANARLGQLPTANIADGAITAAKIPSAQVVKALNGIQDNVTLAAGSNITITPSGNTLTIASSGSSVNAILNQTTPQSNANFNITGSGTADALTAREYRIGGSTFISAPGSQNAFVGVSAGLLNTSGANNSFFGFEAGNSNTSSSFNAFFGSGAGRSSTGASNAFFGFNAGSLNAGGTFNSYFGAGAGSNSSGSSNSFFGRSAGAVNTGSLNAFFGRDAGTSNSSASFNAFFGGFAGTANTTGDENSFFGANAGIANSSGNRNTFLGETSGGANTSGGGNTFIGFNSGIGNVFGDVNTTIGFSANVSAGGLVNATAIGSRAQVSQNNSLVLGSISGTNGATSDTFVGIGTTAPASRLHVNGAIMATGPRTASPVGNAVTLSSDTNADVLQSFNNRPLALNPSGNNVGIGIDTPLRPLHIETGGDTEVMIESTGANGRRWALQSGGTDGRFALIDRTANTNRVTLLLDGSNAPLVGIGTASPTDRVDVNGTLRVRVLAAGGDQSICRNSSTGQVAICNSSRRYKDNIADFSSGIDLIRKLAPVSFAWKSSGAVDVGLVAEDVAAVEPLLATYDEKGKVEGVKYDRVGVVLINAVKEQQAEIEAQRKQIEELKKVVCELLPSSKVCSPK